MSTNFVAVVEMVNLAEDLIFLLSKYQIWRASVQSLQLLPSTCRLDDALSSSDEAVQGLWCEVQRLDPETWKTLMALIDSKRLLVRAGCRTEKESESVEEA